MEGKFVQQPRRDNFSSLRRKTLSFAFRLDKVLRRVQKRYQDSIS
jgi:hypothetical protein